MEKTFELNATINVKGKRRVSTVLERIAEMIREGEESGTIEAHGRVVASYQYAERPAPPVSPPVVDERGPLPSRMLTIDEVLEIVPVTRGTLWRMEKEGKFPPSRYISTNRKAWLQDDVIAWQRGAPAFKGAPRGRHATRRR